MALMDLDLARQTVLQGAVPLPAESVELRFAVGRCLAEAVVADAAEPADDLSAMDGYAVRAADVATALADAPVVLAVVGVSRAGGPPPVTVAGGQAVRIFTGARVPAGADAVVMQEGCTRQDGTVLVRTAAAVGANIRRRGEEYEPGDVLLRAGSVCGPAAIGLLVAAGNDAVAVHRRPRVGLLSIGDEFEGLDQRRRDVNGPMLRAACEQAGATVVETAQRGDTAAAVTAWLMAAAARCDLLLSSGSASVGDYDVIGQAWQDAGVGVWFDGVAMRPGKPCHAGRLPGGPYVIALPGNPLAALTGFEELVAPLLAKLAGRDWRPPLRLRLPLAEELHLKRQARYLVRLGSEHEVTPPVRQGSAPLRQAANAGLTADWQGPVRRAAGWPVEVRPTAEELRGRLLQPVPPLPPVVSVRGDSDSGKTRLVEQLLPLLRGRGLRVGTVKHTACDLAFESLGKDSQRHAAAGAVAVLAVGPNGSVWQRHEPVDQRLGPWLERFCGLVDLVLVEGFKATPLPHLWVSVGEAFSLASGQVDGERQWRLTRPPGESVSFPEELVSELVGQLLEQVGLAS